MGMGAVGSQSTIAVNATTLAGGGASTNTTSVAGASGGGPQPGSVAGAAGGAVDLGSVLTQLTAAIGALQQALQGGGLVGGGPGLPPAPDAGCGCGMPGCGGAPEQAPPTPEQAPPGGKGGDKGDKADKADKNDKNDKGEKADKSEKGDKGDKSDKGGRGGGRPEQGGRTEQRDTPGQTNGGGGSEEPRGADGAPEADQPPADPNAERRQELQDKIRGARQELERITAKMDRLAAERERLGETSSGSSIAAAERRAERLEEIRIEINGLRSAGGYISQSIPIWQKELDRLG